MLIDIRFIFQSCLHMSLFLLPAVNIPVLGEQTKHAQHILPSVCVRFLEDCHIELDSFSIKCVCTIVLVNSYT